MNAPRSNISPPLSHYVKPDELQRVIDQARSEDLGPSGLDITSQCLIPEGQTGCAVMRSRVAQGRLAGAALLALIAKAYDPKIQVEWFIHDGQTVHAGEAIAQLAGPLRGVLAMERVALNLMAHLSGVATLTAQYVQAVAGTKAQIFDTRKTLPGLRGLQKYAVACGGGCNHRMGLYDAVLVKDNHLAHLPDAMAQALHRVHERTQGTEAPPAFVEIEVDTLEQLDRLLKTVGTGRTPGEDPGGDPGVKLDVVLLDNMSVDEMRRAVAIRDRLAPGVALEASGGVRLETVIEVARAGVDRIAVGAITHSAAALDIGLDIMPQPASPIGENHDR